MKRKRRQNSRRLVLQKKKKKRELRMQDLRMNWMMVKMVLIGIGRSV